MSLTYEENGNIPIALDLSINKILYYTEEEIENKAYESIGVFQCIPNFQQMYEFVYVFGASGSGKSFWTANYALAYRKFYPNKNIIIFSQKTADSSFEERTDENGEKINIKNILQMKRIKIDEDILNTTVDITQDFYDCMLIFDDFLYYDNKKITEKICSIITQCLNMGRSRKIYCVITAHLLYQCGSNRQMYQNIQNEIHKLIFFNGVNVFQLTYSLKNYWGFSKRQINEILHIEARKRHNFTCINRLPLYILTNSTCLLVE
jgi:hypothetical protein